MNSYDSLNELKEYQTTYTMHSREWYIINECIEIVHQHTADHIGDANKMVSSEIRDNDMDKIIGNLEREWRPAYNCGELSVGEFHMIRRVITAIRSHLRTTEPVLSVHELIAKHFEEKGYSGVCSRHQGGEDKTCTVCYPQQPDEDRIAEAIVAHCKKYNCYEGVCYTRHMELARNIAGLSKRESVALEKINKALAEILNWADISSTVHDEIHNIRMDIVSIINCSRTHDK